VKLLLEKAVDLDSKDKYGQTALHPAAKSGYEAVVTLLEKAVGVDSKDRDDRKGAVVGGGVPARSSN
jgi:ankyrin repeat protein